MSVLECGDKKTKLFNFHSLINVVKDVTVLFLVVSLNRITLFKGEIKGDGNCGNKILNTSGSRENI